MKRDNAMGLTRERAETFLYREALLADEHRFDEWLALWDETDVTYWIPSNNDDLDPKRQISIAYDDRARLEERLTRLKSRGAHSQQPRSRLRRMVSNISIESDDGALARVEANFMLLELRSGMQDVFGGRLVYSLRYDAAGIRMLAKKVVLVNNDEFIGNLTFLL